MSDRLSFLTPEAVIEVLFVEPPEALLATNWVICSGVSWAKLVGGWRPAGWPWARRPLM